MRFPSVRSFRSFRSFRGQLVVVFVGLFALILATCFLVVAAAVRASARSEINEELRLAGTLFVRQLEARSQQLLGATRLLSGDFALKTAAATADQATTRSVLENHRQRISADVLMLLEPDGTITADTRDPARLGAPFPLPRLLEDAEQAGEASRIAAMDGALYRLAIVPLLAPEPIAWLCAGFAIDDRTAADLRRVTNLHVSFFHRLEPGLTVQASTLDGADRDELQRALAGIRREGVVQLAGRPHIVRVEGISDDVAVVLQRPLAEALAANQGLFRTLFAVGGAGLVLALLGAIVLARRVSRPVLELAGAAQHVAAGDFNAAVSVRRRDEIGELGTTFNAMLAGLRDRERVRAELTRAERLKRFFSPQLAELLSAGDESMLASHRREITVLFCDLRGFTAFAEKADPEDVMRLLRDYHATVGALISRYEGTLERFTGDGLMVFFNDPVPCQDPAARAVQVAIAMRDGVQGLLDEWRRRGFTLGFGTGVDMGYATVGRIGYEGRFDYAAIGTVTNLSARLCQEASDGQILVTQRVYAEVEQLVDAIALDALTLRGFARPLQAFSVLRLRDAAADRQRVDGAGRSPLIRDERR
ncbi:MAG TPA: adenylate/guanylate cyclase domain-containing protein [Methylomirabilota bacterium]